MNRVAITGVGVVSPVGIGYDEFSESLVHGVSGLDAWSGSDDPIWVGELAEFSVNDYLIAEKTYLDRCSELALAATKLCLDHAGLESMPAESERSGLVLGTMFGCAGTMAGYTNRVRQRGTRFATPLLFSHAFVNTPASLVSIDFRLKGYHATVTSGARSGSLALQTALVALNAGHSDAILAGGAEALTPELVAAYRDRMPDLADPDDYDPWAGDGLLLGEGAALLLLETASTAAARGADVLAWLSLAAGSHPTALWLSEANGEQATPAAGPATATAGLWGDALGAADALAAAAGVSALHTGTVPPVLAGTLELPARREPVRRQFDEVRLADLVITRP